MDIENRIIELETKVSYQDHTIQELNEVVIQQQQQIDQLEKNVNQLSGHLKSLNPSDLARPEEEAPPPHY
jgi:SlyX protein